RRPAAGPARHRATRLSSPSGARGGPAPDRELLCGALDHLVVVRQYFDRQHMGAAVDVVQLQRRGGARRGLGNAVEQETYAVTSLQHRVELRGDDEGAVVGAKRLLVRYAAERQAAVGLLPLVFLV